jgi:hypothetical protein
MCLFKRMQLDMIMDRFDALVKKRTAIHNLRDEEVRGSAPYRSLSQKMNIVTRDINTNREQWKKRNDR